MVLRSAGSEMGEWAAESDSSPTFWLDHFAIFENLCRCVRPPSLFDEVIIRGAYMLLHIILNVLCNCRRRADFLDYALESGFVCCCLIIIPCAIPVFIVVAALSVRDCHVILTLRNRNVATLHGHIAWSPCCRSSFFFVVVVVDVV